MKRKIIAIGIICIFLITSIPVVSAEKNKTPVLPDDKFAHVKVQVVDRNGTGIKDCTVKIKEYFFTIGFIFTRIPIWIYIKQGKTNSEGYTQEFSYRPFPSILYLLKEGIAIQIFSPYGQYMGQAEKKYVAPGEHAVVQYMI